VSYVPEAPPPFGVDGSAAARYAYEEFLALARYLAEVNELELRPRHVAPAKPRTGMVVFADGTDWNPGSGEGPYAYNAAGSWVFLG